MGLRYAVGESAGGINFGNGSRLIAANAVGLTVIGWYNLENVNQQGFFDITKNTNSSRIEGALNASSNLVTGGRGADGDSFNAYASATPGEVGIHHYAFILDYVLNTATIYKDGVLIGQGTGMGWTSPTSNTPPSYASMGCYNSAVGSPPYTQGAIHDWRVYKRALTEEEIKTIYSCRGNDNIIQGIDLRVRAVGVTDEVATVANVIEEVNEYAPIGVYGDISIEPDMLSYRRRN